MAEWIGRSPQENCAFNPQAPECANPSNQGATHAVSPTTIVVGNVKTTALPTAVISAATDAVVRLTTTGTNSDGQVWTRVDTVLPTQAVVTKSASTTRAIFTDKPATAQAKSESSNNGLSAGAVAGIAIGTCIAGAVIAFVAAWLLFKRRDKKFVQKTCPSGYPIYADSSPELVMVQKSAATGGPYVQIAQTQMRTPVPVPSRISATGDPLAGIVPPAASEGEVQNRVSALFGQIHRHIDTFYRDVHASITPSMDSDMASFGKDVDMLELLQSCSQPTAALKHALVAFILTITAGKSDGSEQTLWPEELRHMLHANDCDAPHLATPQALHRRLSIYLYIQRAVPQSARSQPRLSNLSALSLARKTSSTIREAAEHFSLTFFPWANPTFGDQEREIDLTGIITEALECRIWLEGQTAEWDFEWEVPGRGAVVLCPAVVVREGGGPRRVVSGQSIVGV